MLIIRELVFNRRKYFSELIQCQEGVATNILSKRLQHLVKEGILDRRPDAKDKKKWIYSLTEKGKDLLPIMVQMGIWGAKYGPRCSIPAQTIEAMKKDPQGVIRDTLKRLEEQS